jgi:hypothetical protein
MVYEKTTSRILRPKLAGMTVPPAIPPESRRELMKRRQTPFSSLPAHARLEAQRLARVDPVCASALGVVA